MASALGNPTSWASQAALNALLRYAPQKEALKDLQRAAEEQFASSVQAGKSESTLGVQQAQAAVAPTKQVFSSARTEGERGRSLAAPVLAALSSASPFAAAAANEQAAGTERLAGSEAHALSDLQQRKVAAAELPAFTRSSATATLLSELQKLQQKGSALEGAEGADKAAETGKLRDEANRLGVTERDAQAQNATSERDSIRSSSTSRANSKESNQVGREAATGAAGSKPLTTKEQNEGLSLIQEIRHYAGEAPPGTSRAQRVAVLTSGVPASSEKNVKGGTSKTSAIPAFKPDVRMSAALDLAEYGHLTRATEKRLEAAGYNVASLGIPRAASGKGPIGGAGALGEAVLKALKP